MTGPANSFTSPVTPISSQSGTSTNGGFLGGNPAAPTGPVSVPTALNNQRQTTQFPTLAPPMQQTAVYAPNVQIQIMSDLTGLPYDVSTDIIRGQVVRKENSCSSLFFTLGNKDLRYTQNSRFARMDRVTVQLTRTSPVQVFSGYLDTIPWMQAYPGEVNFRATCTLKRLLHTWWNPALPQSVGFFQQMAIGQDTGASDSGIGQVMYNILTQVGQWLPTMIHIETYPQALLTFLSNYFVENNLAATNIQAENSFNQLITGPDTAGGPGAAVGYQASDPVGTQATIANDVPTFFAGQIVTACDARGLGPIVDTTANSQTITQASDVLESAAGTGGLDSEQLATDVHQAGQQLGQYASNQATQNSDSDAAIYALACVIANSGGTGDIQLPANAADPTTLTFFHTTLTTQGTDAGLFLQDNTGRWGTPEQRMNPLSSAGMFLDALNAQTGWRNMDVGQAIWQVQQSDTAMIAAYNAAVPTATTMVAAYRQTTQGASNAASDIANQIPGAGNLLNMGGGGANTLAGLAGQAAGQAVTGGPTAASTAVAAASDGTQPDSEGAINAAMAYLATPYSQTIGGGTTPGVGLDCSGLVQCAFASVGVPVPRSTFGYQGSAVPFIGTNIALAQRGDVILVAGNSHTGIYLGGGLWVQTGGPDGTPGSVQPVQPGVSGVYRVCGNSGNPAAPFTPVTSGNTGAGIPPGTGTGGTTGTGGDSASGQEPIARNLFSYIFEPQNYATQSSYFFTGEKKYLDDQPLIQIVTSLCTASMRSFQSGPDGSFIAYYPDPFGVNGKAAIFDLEDIELVDCHIDVSDDPMATHVYIEGDYTMMGQADQTAGWIGTSGVATVENAALWKMLAGASPGDIDANWTPAQLLQRFGVRPYKNSYALAGNAGLEFLLACQTFMGKWAAQYSTDIGMTFMPELLPGMRVNMVGHNLTVYVSEVTHEFDWSSGFKTRATVSAATNPNAAYAMYSQLPGFLNTVNSNPNGAGNTNSSAPSPTGAGYQGILPGGPANSIAGTLPYAGGGLG